VAVENVQLLQIGNWQLAIGNRRYALFLVDFHRYPATGFSLDGFWSGGQHWTGDCGRQTYRFGVFEIRIDGGDDYARFDCDQVDTHERDSHPRVDYDALVENSIKNVY